MEKDYQLALQKIWQTVWCPRKGKQYPVSPVYSVGGQLLTSTMDIVGRWKEYFEDLLNPPTCLLLRKQKLRVQRWTCPSP